MIRIAIVDDESMFINNFKKLVEEKCEFYNIVCEILTYTNGMDFQKIYVENNFDLIFLDIDMPDITGIQIAANLRKKQINTTLLFVSAHEQFVFESIHYKPFRFIRKSDLIADVDEAIQSYSELIKKADRTKKFIIEGQKEISIDLSEIIYFYSIRHDIFYVIESGESFRLARRYTLELLETDLNKYGFVRSHKTYIVNCAYIYKIGTSIITLKNGMTVDVSRGCKENVKKEFNIFLREEETL